MKKTIPFKLNNSHNNLVILSLIFTILLFSSPFTSILPQTASAQGTWTVSFDLGAGTTESSRGPYTEVPDGTLLKDVTGINLSPPTPSPGWAFTGWLPVIDGNAPVTSNIDYTAQWLEDCTSDNPYNVHLWSRVIGPSSHWKVPDGAFLLQFTGVSLSGQTTLDHAYMVIEPSGAASIYFLCFTLHSKPGTVDYCGISAVQLLGVTVNSAEYSVWKLDLSEEVVKSITANGLSGDFNYIMGNGNGQAIRGATLTFTNVRAVTEHYIYEFDPDATDGIKDVELFMTTPLVGVEGSPVTAIPIYIIGYFYNDTTTVNLGGPKSGTVPSSGSLTLKLYYQKESDKPLWEIASSIQGVEQIRVYYNGKLRTLSDLVPPDHLIENKLFTIIWPEAVFPDTDPTYILIGDVRWPDPFGTHVGIYTQDLSVTENYKVYYKGYYSKLLDPSNLVELYPGDLYEDITLVMKYPATVPVSLVIDPVPLTITTANDTKKYDGVALTKTNTPPIVTGLDEDGNPVQYSVATTEDPDKYIVTLVNGETMGFTFNGTQTIPGKSPNTYKLQWKDIDDPSNLFTAEETDYEIVFKNLGELDVYGTVIYNENFPDGAGTGAVPTDSVHYYEDDLVTIQDNSGNLAVPGYTFAGWNTASDGKGNSYPIGSANMPAENLELYAQWTQDVYTVVYAPGDQGVWDAEDETYTGLHYGVSMPAFGTLSHKSVATNHITGWSFDYWEPSLPLTVPDAKTGDVTVLTYTARWHRDVYVYIYAPGDHGLWDAEDETYDEGYYYGIPVPDFGGKTSLSQYTAHDPGYSFVDWTVSNEGDLDGITIYVTYTALWRAIDYSVTYNANGGTDAPIDSAVYHVGNTVTVLSDEPSKYGYTFAGWLYDDNTYIGGGSFTMPAANVELVAQWDAVDDIEVSFDVNAPVGATVVSGPSPLSKVVEFDGAYGALAVVDVYGYVFAGWFTDATGGTEVTSSTVVSVAEDHVLYAQWDAVDYTIVYDPGEHGSWSAVDETYAECHFGDPMSAYPFGHNLDTDHDSGWIFDGWDDGQIVYPTTEDLPITVVRSVTYVAQWRALTDVEYVVHYYLQGTTDELVAAYPAGKLVIGQTMASMVSENAVPILGYVVDEEIKSLRLEATGNEIVFYYTEDLTSYVVHYYLWDGGATVDKVANDKVVSDLLVGTVVAEDAVSILGFDVYGVSSKSLTLGVSGNVIVFYYTFKDPLEVMYYTVEYDGNGASGGVVPVDVHSPYVSGSVVQLLGSDGLVREGYTFLGWSTRDDAVVVEYGVGSSFNIFRSVKLFAVWEPVPTYTVTYSPGAYGTFDEVVYDGLVLGAVTPGFVGVPSGSVGYIFVGWSPLVVSTVTGSVTYVAQWSAVYTVTYAVGDRGTFTPQVYSDLAYGAVTPGFVGTPSGGSGYVFAGWSPLVASTVTGSVTYVAQWSVVSSGSSSGGGSTVVSKPVPAATAKPAPTESPEPKDIPIDVTPIPKVWALVNLILSVTGLILAIVVVIFVLLMQRKQNQQGVQSQKKLGLKSRGMWLMTAFVMGVVGVVVFLFTENMCNVRVWFDNWTIVNAILFVVEIVAIVLLFTCARIVGGKEDRKPSN